MKAAVVQIMTEWQSSQHESAALLVQLANQRDPHELTGEEIVCRNAVYESLIDVSCGFSTAAWMTPPLTVGDYSPTRG